MTMVYAPMWLLLSLAIVCFMFGAFIGRISTNHFNSKDYK